MQLMNRINPASIIAVIGIDTGKYGAIIKSHYKDTCFLYELHRYSSNAIVARDINAFGAAIVTHSNPHLPDLLLHAVHIWVFTLPSALEMFTIYLDVELKNKARAFIDKLPEGLYICFDAATKELFSIS